MTGYRRAPFTCRALLTQAVAQPVGSPEEALDVSRLLLNSGSARGAGALVVRLYSPCVHGMIICLCLKTPPFHGRLTTVGLNK